MRSSTRKIPTAGLLVLTLLGFALSGCATALTDNCPPIPAPVLVHVQLPASRIPGPVAIADPVAGESAVAAVARERAARLENARRLEDAEKFYEDVVTKIGDHNGTE